LVSPDPHVLFPLYTGLPTLQGACAYQRQKARMVSWSVSATTFIAFISRKLSLLFVYNG